MQGRGGGVGGVFTENKDRERGLFWCLLEPFREMLHMCVPR